MYSAKLFTNGQSQAVRLPKACRFNEKEVYIKKIGESVILVPKHAVWDEFMDSLNMFTPDFMDERNQGELQQREDLF